MLPIKPKTPHRYLDKWRLFLTDFLNLHCLQCQQKNFSPLCQDCADQQKSFSSRCQTCLNITTQNVCLVCRNSPPTFDLLMVRWRYQQNVRTWIHKAKFYADRVALQILNEEAQCLAKSLPVDSFDVIVPMPIPKYRLAFRGFNQTLFIARGVAKITGKPIQKQILLRHYRLQQVKMPNRQARERNIKQSFFINKTPPKRILLVDDVITTGATLSEAGKMLKIAGATWVGALVIAGK